MAHQLWPLMYSLIKRACSLLSQWEGKAGLRPGGTRCSPAYSAQSFSPCLSLFVERLIKERSALRGFSHVRVLLSGWIRTSHYVSQWGTLRDVRARTHARPRTPACEQTCTGELTHKQLNFTTPKLRILSTFETTSLYEIDSEMMIESSKYVSVLTVLRLWAVMREVGSKRAEPPVISDENLRIKRFFSLSSSFLLFFFLPCASLLNPRHP